MDEDWVPMPAQALSWSAKDKVFVLNHDVPDTKTQSTSRQHGARTGR